MRAHTACAPEQPGGTSLPRTTDGPFPVLGRFMFHGNLRIRIDAHRPMMRGGMSRSAKSSTTRYPAICAHYACRSAMQQRNARAHTQQRVQGRRSRSFGLTRPLPATPCVYSVSVLSSQLDYNSFIGPDVSRALDSLSRCERERIARANMSRVDDATG